INMASVTQTGPLPPGTNYPASTSLTVPYVFSGTYYVLVWADAGNSLGENSTLNSNSGLALGPLQVTQAPLPDLQVGGVRAPLSALEGQNIVVTWAVTNSGLGPTIAGQWSDYLYLSLDQVPDPTDTFLGYATRSGDLTNGQTYSQSLSVQLPR